MTCIMSDMTDVLKVLRSVDGWVADEKKDNVMLDNIKQQYPKINLLEEARAWQVWMLDFKAKKNVNHRSRFRNWCKKATEFKENDGKIRSTSRENGRSHRVAEKEGHGDEVQFTESW